MVDKYFKSKFSAGYGQCGIRRKKAGRYEDVSPGRHSYHLFYISYFSRNKKGEPLKAATIAIRGVGGRIIGLLCINFYLNTPLSHLLDSLCAPAQQSPAVTETFAENTRELVVQSVEQARAQVMADGSILPSNKNREIVALLHRWNIFKIKDSVPLTAQALDISPNTVYLHLRNVRQEEDA